MKKTTPNRQALALFDRFTAFQKGILSARSDYETEILSYNLADAIDALYDYKIENNEQVSPTFKQDMQDLCLNCMHEVSGVTPENPMLFLKRTITDGFLRIANRALVDKIDFDSVYWTNVLNNDRPEKVFERIDYIIACLDKNKEYYKNFIEDNQWSTKTQIQMATQKASDEIRNIKRKIRQFKIFVNEAQRERQ